jgi:hypothetical protein
MVRTPLKKISGEQERKMTKKSNGRVEQAKNVTAIVEEAMANTPKKAVSKPAVKAPAKKAVKPTTTTPDVPTKRQKQVKPSTISVKTTKPSSATPIYDSVVKEKGFDPLKPKKSVSKPAVKTPVKKKVR